MVSDLLIPALVVLLLVAFAAGVVVTMALRRKGLVFKPQVTKVTKAAVAAPDVAPLAFRAAVDDDIPLAVTPTEVPLTLTRDYAVLKEEILTDPANLGYAPRVKKQNYEGIAKLLNDIPLIPNPVPQGTKPRRLKLRTIVGKMTLAEALEFYKIGKLVEHVEQTLEPDDRARLIGLLNICDPFLSDATEAKLDTLLNETVPDEDWQANIPGTSRATNIGWPIVKPADVQQVLG